ncbi:MULTISPECIES: hypothetical protein [unclassified Luteimonas]
MRIRFLLLPFLLLPALSAPALAQMQQPPEPTQEELERAQQRAEAWQAYSLRVARALGRSDGARDLALAAVLEATARPNEGATVLAADAARWRAEAATKGAGDTITQQLLVAAAMVGDHQAGAAAAARRWQSLEPGNLAPVMFQGLDAEGVLAAAAQSGRNTPDPYPLQRWAAGALRRHPPTASEWATLDDGARPSNEVHAAGWAASLQALLLPDYREVLGACTGRELRAPGRAAACGRMAELLLARPQTVLDERIGLSMAREQAGSAAEAGALDARRRGVDWRQEQLGELAMREDGDDAAFARLLADPSLDTEDQLGRRLLSAAGVAIEPPAGWQAPWQRRR